MNNKSPLPSHLPLTEEFKKSLTGGKYLTWAQDLDSETLYTLLWLIGEFGLRSDQGNQFAPETMKDFEQLIEKRQHLALEMIGRIVEGERISQPGLAASIKAVTDGLAARS